MKFLAFIGGLLTILIKFVEDIVHVFKDLLDAMNSDGGHVLLACVLMIAGAWLITNGFADPGKELFIAMLAILTYAMKGTGKANGIGKTTSVVEKTEITESKATGGTTTPNLPPDPPAAPSV